MRTSRLLFAVGIVSAAIAACSPAVVGGPRPGAPGDDRRPQPLPRPSTSASPGSNTMRYICRGQQVSGWIAVDYISDTEVCSTGANTNYRYNTAVIMKLSNVAMGGSLEVCASERIPANWSHVRTIVDSKRCPSEKPTADPAIGTVREIMRNR